MVKLTENLLPKLVALQVKGRRVGTLLQAVYHPPHAHHFLSAGSVRSLCYDAERRILFSGGFDELVVVWDIGSQKGTAFELLGHK